MTFDALRTLTKFVLPDRPRSRMARYAVASILPIISIFIADRFFALPAAPFFPLFTISVILAAVYGGWGPGVVCTIVSAAVNAIALPPSFSILVESRDSALRLLVFAVSGFFISAFMATIRSLQQKLELERERHRITLTSIGDAVIATDEKGVITFMNAVAEEATGWTQSAAIGHALEDVFKIVNEATRQGVDNPIRKVFELGRIVGLANHTVLIRRDGSEIPIDDSAAPIRDSQKRIVGAVLVFRDITQQKKSEAALLHAEKLASVGKLAATIAHEVNNPLEAISNLLYLIRGTEDVREVQEHASAAQEQLSRASEITKQTLSFARRDDKSEVVNVSDLVDGVLALYSNKIHGKKVKVHKRCAPRVAVIASRSEIRQVLGNLIGNALDAIRKEGALHIRICVSTYDGTPTCRLVIADSGEGIKPEHLPKIFDAFFSTKRDVGTGLGLWVTKRIIEANAGTVRVRSTLGRGTVVRICLPAIKDTQTVSSEVQTNSDSAAASIRMSLGVVHPLPDASKITE